MVPKQMCLAFVCICGFAGIFYYTLLTFGRFTLPGKTYRPVNGVVLALSRQQLEITRLKTEAYPQIRVESYQQRPKVHTDSTTTSYIENSLANLEAFTIDRPSKEKLQKFRSDDRLDEKFLRNDERSIERIVEGINDQESLTKNGGIFKKNGQLAKRLPAVIIMGVKKGGTRALLEMLKLHPRICTCGPEMHFFDRHYVQGLAWYRDKMPLCYENEVTVEKTPSYFVTSGVEKDVLNYSKSLNHTLRLLVILRDPTTRAISDYTQNLHKSPERRSPRKLLSSFEDLALTETHNGSMEVNLRWGAIKIGVYSKHLRRWFNYFTPEQIHVVSGEGLIKEPYDEIKKVERFLGLSPFIKPEHFVYNETKGFYCFDRSLSKNEVTTTATTPLHCLGTSKGRSHTKINEHAEKLLRDFYRPFNEELYRMIGRNFGWL